MAQIPVRKVYSASSRGLVTDGNALARMEQSNLSESNYELLRDGTRRRRRPVLQERGDLSTWLGASNDLPVSSYIWKTPAHKTQLSFVVEELEGDITFYPLGFCRVGILRLWVGNQQWSGIGKFM